MALWKCRMTMVDSNRRLASFADSSGWIKTLGACHLEWLELSPGRHVCQFETKLQQVERLRKVSRRWARLTLLLDYEDEANRIKGVAKAKAGHVEHCEISY